MATLSPPPLMPKRSEFLTLPNQLTVLRLVLAIVIFILIEQPQLEHRWWWCLSVFIAATVTDFLDGYLARKLGLGSLLGRNLDPLVDKILICGAYVFLLTFPESGLKAWMVVVVVSRELLVTGLRTFMESQGTPFGADWAGKLKMVLQCAALIAIFVVEAMRPHDGPTWLPIVRDVLLYAMVLSTVQSALQYLWKASRGLRS